MLTILEVIQESGAFESFFGNSVWYINFCLTLVDWVPLLGCCTLPFITKHSFTKKKGVFWVCEKCLRLVCIMLRNHISLGVLEWGLYPILLKKFATLLLR